MADVRVALVPGTVFGGYRIESFVARGGMGMIYKATQLALDRTVALKLVAPELADDEDFRERFKREAHRAAAIDHSNIVPVYEAGEIDGQLFLAMRFVVGTDLQTTLAQERRLSPQRAAAIIVQVAGALDAAHDRGLVHRDVKPGNILISEEYGEERAYLTDFGLTKNTATEAHLTRTGHVVGTLDYIAPEQVEGHAVDGRADTYALACVMYRAVTGRIPFDRPTEVAKMWAHLNDPPPSAAEASPTVSPELDATIRRGMAKRPEERYSSTGQFARAARAAVAPAISAPRDRTDIAATQIDPTVVEPLTPDVPERRAGVPGAAGGRSWIGDRFARNRVATYAAGALLVLVVGAIVAIVASGGGKAQATGTVPPQAATTPGTTSQPTTSTSVAAAQAATYHAQVLSIIPRMQTIFSNFPRAKDFGKPIFSQTALSVAAGLRGIADSLDALSPPPQVLVDHEALVTHLHEMEQAFRSLAADSDSRDFRSANTDLNRTRVALGQIHASVDRVETG